MERMHFVVNCHVCLEVTSPATLLQKPATNTPDHAANGTKMQLQNVIQLQKSPCAFRGRSCAKQTVYKTKHKSLRGGQPLATKTFSGVDGKKLKEKKCY